MRTHDLYQCFAHRVKSQTGRFISTVAASLVEVGACVLDTQVDGRADATHSLGADVIKLNVRRVALRGPKAAQIVC